MVSPTDYKKGAQLFKALAHPIRLFIVERMHKKDKCVKH